MATASREFLRSAVGSDAATRCLSAPLRDDALRKILGLLPVDEEVLWLAPRFTWPNSAAVTNVGLRVLSTSMDREGGQWFVAYGGRELSGLPWSDVAAASATKRGKFTLYFHSGIRASVRLDILALPNDGADLMVGLQTILADLGMPKVRPRGDFEDLPLEALLADIPRPPDHAPKPAGAQLQQPLARPPLAAPPAATGGVALLRPDFTEAVVGLGGKKQIRRVKELHDWLVYELDPPVGPDEPVVAATNYQVGSWGRLPDHVLLVTRLRLAFTNDQGMRTVPLTRINPDLVGYKPGIVFSELTLALDDGSSLHFHKCATHMVRSLIPRVILGARALRAD